MQRAAILFRSAFRGQLCVTFQTLSVIPAWGYRASRAAQKPRMCIFSKLLTDQPQAIYASRRYKGLLANSILIFSARFLHDAERTDFKREHARRDKYASDTLQIPDALDEHEHSCKMPLFAVATWPVCARFHCYIRTACSVMHMHAYFGSDIALLGFHTISVQLFNACGYFRRICVAWHLRP